MQKAKKHLSQDNVLKDIIDRLEILNIDGAGNVYNELVKNIVYQQISYKAADKIYERLNTLIGNIQYQPEDLLSKSHAEIKSVGLSNQKTNYVINISEFFIENNLMHYNWEDYSDKDVAELLTQIKGVGTWTAEMILIFELCRTDVLPVKDLAIRLAIKELYGLTSVKKELVADMYKIAEAWQPYRTYASLYLWSWCREQAQLKKKNVSSKKGL